MSKGIELLKTDEVAKELGKKREFVTSEIRKGKIKAVKSGGEYLISRRDLNTYLGIESEDELLRKDLIIKELQAKIQSYEVKFNAFKGMLSTMKNMVEV